jgi:beta-lactamase superfamily II metal-dependent hydrolase
MGVATTLATRPFAWISWREPYLPLQLYTKWQERWLKFRQQAAVAFGASTAASVGSVPLTLWHFGFLSPISILASTLIGVFVLALMGLALLAVFLSPIAPPLQQLVNKGNGHVAAGCTGIARFFASVPGGNHTFARDRPGEDFLVAYDPGYGNGAALLHDGDSTVLFDAGSASGFEHMLLPSLRHFSLEPRHLVLSHPDGGHIGGAAGAIEAFPVRQILAPVTKARSKLYRDLLAKAERRGVAVVLGNRQGSYRISDAAWIEVLHEPDAGSQNLMADERVMVCRLHWRGWRILFLSDAGWGIERAMLESGRDLSADVIVAGRHRNDSSMGDAFLDAVKPQAIIAGHADFPYAERIPARWAADCESRGIRLFHQGKTGAVSLVPGEDHSLELRGFLDGSSLRLSR